MPVMMIGWQEWCALPGLGLPAVKAKIDTGATTSALHAFDISTLTREGKEWVRFAVHPVQRRTDIIRYAEAPLVDRRIIVDSGGHREERFVVKTCLALRSAMPSRLHEWEGDFPVSTRSLLKVGEYTNPEKATSPVLKCEPYSWDIEITLTDRETMKYRMLLGRRALEHRAMIDPAASFCLGRLSGGQVKAFYL